jgi:hypothetical protein
LYVNKFCDQWAKKEKRIVNPKIIAIDFDDIPLHNAHPDIREPKPEVLKLIASLLEEQRRNANQISEANPLYGGEVRKVYVDCFWDDKEGKVYEIERASIH